MGQRDPAQQQIDFVARVEAQDQARAVTPAELRTHGIPAPILLAPIRLRTVVDVAAKQPVPVDIRHHGPDFARRSSRRVGAAHEPAHARAGDRIDRNPVLLEPFEDPDVRESARRASTEREPHARAAFLRLRHGRAHQRHNEQQQLGIVALG